MNHKAPSISKAKWHGREAYSLSNGTVRAVALTGGGHIAELNLLGRPASISPLWVPPWKTMEPYQYRSRLHGSQYGGITEGKLLSGLAGHNICLDYFGSPSAEEAKQGLSQHGEAPNSRWVRRRRSVKGSGAALSFAVRLPAARLLFEREIAVHDAEPVVYFRETVTNLGKADHFFHWTQHVTLGPPFLEKDQVRVSLPGTRGMTFPHGYDEGKGLLASGEEFTWPLAPKAPTGNVDLSQPLSQEGLGYVAGMLLDANEELGYVAAVNLHRHLLIAYCFRRADFPWVAMWEENKAIEAVPWQSSTVALGLEFGTTPLPVPRRENFVDRGPLFGVPTVACVPARGSRTVGYLALLARLPDGFGAVKKITREGDSIVISSSARDPVRIKASRLGETLHL